jgi:HEAT repeat protein
MLADGAWLRTALIVAIQVLFVIFVVLNLLLVAQKGWRESRDRLRRARRTLLEPRVLAYSHADEGVLASFLERRPVSRDRPVLEEILLDHAQRVRGIERRRLGRALDEIGVVDRYLGELAHPRWWRRADAAERLGFAGVSRATERLAEMLEDESSEVRLRAARSLGQVGGRASIRSLIGTLNQPNRWSVIRMADILAEMGPEVVGELVAAFPDLRLPGRVAALDILGRVRPLHVTPWLCVRLEEPEPDLRARAAHALGEIGDPHAGKALRAVLRDSSWPVRAMGAKALGRIRHREAIPELCDAMRDAEWWVRVNAAEALKRLGGAGIAALRSMLADVDPYAQQQAVLMLEETGIIDQQVELLAQEDGEERKEAELLLAQLVRIGCTGRLEELAARNRHPQVRAALELLLAPGTDRGKP